MRQPWGNRGWFLLVPLGLAACGGPPVPVSVPPRPAVATPLAQCMAKLTAGQVAFAPIKDFRTAQGCGVTGGIRESGGGPATLSRPTVLSCDMALRLLDFETEVIEPLAGNVLHQRVIRIDHAGSYSCRVLAERPEQLSQHAFGKAIDIMGFGLADGSTISVVKDWHGKGSKAAFLHQLARQACGRFSVVLTPNANRAHFNHIHMDIGPQKYCR